MKIKKLKFREKHLNFLLLGFAIAFGVVVTSIAYHSYPREYVRNKTFEIYSSLFFVHERVRYPSNVEIVESKEEGMLLGFVTDPWNLNFGIIPTGGNFGTRHLKVFNSEDYKVRVNLRAYGDIKPLVTFSKNNFILAPNETAEVDIFLNTTNSTKPGNYTGEIDVIIKKPRLNILEIFL